MRRTGLFGKEQRCRQGALRGRRSLRDVYTGFAVGLPLVGARICVSDQREPHAEGSPAVRAAPQWARPAGLDRHSLEVCVIGRQSGPAAGAELEGQRRRGSEAVLCDVGEDQPVVPLPSALLKLLEGLGEAAWFSRLPGAVLGDVAGKFSDLTDGVEMLRVVGVPGRGGHVVVEPLLRERGEAGGGEGEVFGRLEGIEQAFEGEGEVGLTALENFEKLFGMSRAAVLEGGAEFIGVGAKPAGGAAGKGGLDEIELNVDVADLSGCSAKLLQDARSLTGEPRVVWDSGEEIEHGQLAFDAAGGGAETVDGLLLRVGEAEGDGRLECGNVFAKGVDWKRRGGRAGHREFDAKQDTAIWPAAPPDGRLDKEPPEP